MGPLQWLRDRRRRKILEQPWPSEWERIGARNVAHSRFLTQEQRLRLRDLVQVFVAEKRFEGAGGLVMDDEIRLTIAADACLMVLELPHDLYRKVDHIIVYPSTMVTPERTMGVAHVTTEPVSGGMPISGQAFAKGPILLSWDAVRRGARHPERGHNVVFHEFAHKLDMLDGSADGTPPLDSRQQFDTWVRVCEQSYGRLRARSEQGLPTALDPYGGVNVAEFFAVATEAFFNVPQQLRAQEPALYQVLAGFYHQDPARDWQEG